MTSVNIYPTQKDTVIHELTVDNDFRITKKITINDSMEYVNIFVSQKRVMVQWMMHLFLRRKKKIMIQ